MQEGVSIYVQYAHSLPDRPHAKWEPLCDHLTQVAERAGALAAVFGWRAAACLAGRLHDISKASVQF
jgi:HD superfamily phosphodiesterase